VILGVSYGSAPLSAPVGYAIVSRLDLVEKTSMCVGGGGDGEDWQTMAVARLMASDRRRYRGRRGNAGASAQHDFAAVNPDRLTRDEAGLV